MKLYDGGNRRDSEGWSPSFITCPSRGQVMKEKGYESWSDSIEAPGWGTYSFDVFVKSSEIISGNKIDVAINDLIAWVNDECVYVAQGWEQAKFEAKQVLGDQYDYDKLIPFVVSFSGTIAENNRVEWHLNEDLFDSQVFQLF